MYVCMFIKLCTVPLHFQDGLRVASTLLVSFDLSKVIPTCTCWVFDYVRFIFVQYARIVLQCNPAVKFSSVFVWSLPGILQNGQCQASYKMVTARQVTVRHVTKWSLSGILQKGHTKVVMWQNGYMLQMLSHFWQVNAHDILLFCDWRAKRRRNKLKKPHEFQSSIISGNFAVGYIAVYSLYQLSTFVFMVRQVNLLSVVVGFLDTQNGGHWRISAWNHKLCISFNHFLQVLRDRHGTTLPGDVGLSVGYSTCPSIDWHRHFVIGWSK